MNALHRLISMPGRRPPRRATRPRLEVLEVRAVPASFAVTAVGDNGGVNPAPFAGTGTLRQALVDANANAGLDLITFAIASGARTISPQGALPTITDSVILDGTTQPGFAGVPIIELDGSAAGTGVNGLTLRAADSAIRGLVINRFDGDGLLLIGPAATRSAIAGNYIGTDVGGTKAIPNLGCGVRVRDGANQNTIGGVATADRNVLSGNAQAGVLIEGVGTDRNAIAGNYINVDATGASALRNGGGVAIFDGPDSTAIGVPGGGNVIGPGAFTSIRIYSANGIRSCNNTRIQANRIGTDASGAVALPPGNYGTTIDGSTGTLIGGSGDAERNIIANGIGVGMFADPETGLTISGNYLGLDPTGLRRVGVGSIVIRSSASNVLIGGTTPETRNVIVSGPGAYAIRIENSAGTTSRIQGNYIGTDRTGLSGFAGTGSGVGLLSAQPWVIGGTGPGEGNVISGNSGGSGIDGGSPASFIQGNYIGLGADGTTVVPNLRGIVSGGGATIGGGAPGAGNVISGNLEDGISGGTIRGNYIGLNAAGDAARPNGLSGIVTSGGDILDNVIAGNGENGIFMRGTLGASTVIAGNLIGTNKSGTAKIGNGLSGIQIYIVGAFPGATLRIGTDGDGKNDAAERNVISGSVRGSGIFYGHLASAPVDLVVAGNYVGTDATGTRAFPNNGRAGVFIANPSGTVIVGGDIEAERNIISGNAGPGVRVNGEVGSVRTTISGNSIGTDATGTAALGNAVGVQIEVGATGVVVGGPTAGNLISGNARAGVLVIGTGTTGNQIRGNAIYGNGGLGIDLNDDGVTPNDSGDGDGGPNGLQNFPVLSSFNSGSTTRVGGSLNTRPNTVLTIDVYANAATEPLGYEGRRHLGSFQVRTYGAGDVSFNETLTGATFATEKITATATGPDGTSEFSGELAVTNRPPTARPGGPYVVDEGGLVVLDASASDDPNQLGSTLLYEWDLDGDGIFGEIGPGALRGTETGAFVGFSAAGLDGPTSVLVSLRVTDDGGLSHTATARIYVVNVAPTVYPSYVKIAQDGVATLSGTILDPGAEDTFTLRVDWGDGTITTFGYPSGTREFSETHRYPDGLLTASAPDVIMFHVTWTDDDGGAGGATRVALVDTPSDVGGLDPTFGLGGFVSTDFTPAMLPSPGYLSSDFGFRARVQADGRVVVVGSASLDGTDVAVARYNVDGSLDATFGVGGKQLIDFGGEDEGSGIAFQGDKIVLTGLSWNWEGEARVIVARLNGDGSLDTAFDGDGRLIIDFVPGTQVYPVYVQNVVAQGNKIVVAGGVYSEDTGYDIAVVRLNDDGSLDTTFADMGRDFIDLGYVAWPASMCVRADGKILVAVEGDEMVLRLNADGGLDTTFDGDGVSHLPSFDITGMALQADGKIVLAGGLWAGDDSPVVIRLNEDGSYDTAFGDGGKQTVGALSMMYAAAVAVQSDGKVVLVGPTTWSDGSFYTVARLTVDGRPDPTFDGNGMQISTLDGLLVSDLAIGVDGNLVVAGTFPFPYDFGLARIKAGPLDVVGQEQVTTQLRNLVLVAGSPDQKAEVSYRAVSNDQLTQVIHAANRFDPSTNPDGLTAAPVGTLTIRVSMTRGEYGGQVIDLPANVSLVIYGASGGAPTTFEGHSPAFTVVSGSVTVSGVTFTNATDAPTILVTGGRLTLRNSTVQESTGYAQAAIRITGGAADLGTEADLGGNFINVSGAGVLIDNRGSLAVSAVGTFFRIDARPLAPSSLSGLVFADFNDDGQVDFGEQGVAGTTITLFGTDFLGNRVGPLTQQTDTDGAYVFLSLLPGSYRITETQPAGYTQGTNAVGSAGGTVAIDRFDLTLGAALDALNYNFGERPAATGAVGQGQTAGIGFWYNKNGQALIKALNGGAASTQLGNWLAATFPNMFGMNSGNGNLTGKSNVDVAAFFQSRFVLKGEKLDAQVLATALAVYVTNATLNSTHIGSQHGFVIAGNGVGTATFNVGADGEAFGVANNTTMTVMDLLLAADAQSVHGVLYNGNTTRRKKANNVFGAVNQAGRI